MQAGCELTKVPINVNMKLYLKWLLRRIKLFKSVDAQISNSATFIRVHDHHVINEILLLLMGSMDLVNVIITFDFQMLLLIESSKDFSSSFLVSFFLFK